jgi:hypothetical protein
MSFKSFFRFCFDAGLFPEAANFQTLRRLYDTATAAIVHEAKCLKLEPRLKKCKKTAGHGRGRRGSVKGDQQTGRSPAGSPTMILWHGRQLPPHLTWLTSGGINDKCVCTSLLIAIGDWLADRGVSLREFFALLEANSSISIEDFVSGLEFMSFRTPPSPEEKRQTFEIVAGCSEGTQRCLLPLATLELAVAVSREMRQEQVSDANCFTKRPNEMTAQERVAWHFLRQVLAALEERHWTPKDLFAQLGIKAGDSLPADQWSRRLSLLLLKGRGFGESSLELLASQMAGSTRSEKRGDVEVPCEILGEYMARADEAWQRQRRAESRSHPLLRCAEAQGGVVSPTGQAVKLGVNDGEYSKRPSHIFGVAAFAECITKAAFGQLGKHGTPEQARLPALSQFAWLTALIRWRLGERLKTESPPPSAGGPCFGPCATTPLQILGPQLEELFERPAACGSFAWGSPSDQFLKAYLDSGQPHPECLGRALWSSALACPPNSGTVDLE